MSREFNNMYKREKENPYYPYLSKWDEFWHRPTISKAAALILIAGAAVYGCIELKKTADAETARERKEVSTQLRRDGFPAHDQGLHRGSVDLSVGNCKFYGVTVEPIEEDGKITDLKNYRMYTGNGNIEINFENASQLQQALPDINCAPNR